MNLERKHLSLILLIALILVLIGPVLFPSWRLNFFAPFLIVLYYQKSYLACLWASFFCGLILDLLSADTRFGIHALEYCLTTAILYGQRRNFFSDSLVTLPLMTFFFSVVATVIEWVASYIFGNEIGVTWQWMVTDLLYMPAWDAACAFLLFILPVFIFGKPPRRGKDYFLDRSESI